MKILCKLLGHKWDMWRGFYPKEYIHDKAVCERCNLTYKEYKKTKIMKLINKA